MKINYHDHVCNECDSLIKDHCECSAPDEEEEYCRSCTMKSKVSEEEPSIEEPEVEEPSVEGELTEEEFYDDTARRIAEGLPKQNQ